MNEGRKVSLIKWHRYYFSYSLYHLYGDVGEDKSVFVIWEDHPKRRCSSKWGMTFEKIEGKRNYFFATQRAAKKYAEILAFLWIFKSKKYF